MSVYVSTAFDVKAHVMDAQTMKIFEKWQISNSGEGVR